MKLLLISLLFVSCVTPIEHRCLEANLKIDELAIEDTINNKSHARVKCSSKEKI